MSMAFERPEGDDTYSSYEVSLMRGNEEYFAQLKVESAHKLRTLEVSCPSECC